MTIMKSRFYCIVMLLVMAMQVSASPVDEATARDHALQFLRNKTANGFHATPPSLRWIHSESSSEDASLAVYYLINTSQGFVVMSAEDRAQEILAWGDAPLDDMSD